MGKPNLLSLGFFRIGVASPQGRTADVDFNLQVIKDIVKEGEDAGCHLMVFPELSITGYTCGDLFYQQHLLTKAQGAVCDLAQFLAEKDIAVIIGLPVSLRGKIFNCAAFLSQGKVCGVVPKTFLPNSNEYYEERWFSTSKDASMEECSWRSQKIPFGADLLFRFRPFPQCLIGVEICEDLWAIEPPSGQMAMAGATVICNLSASNETLSKADYRRSLIASQSARCLASYAYAGAGGGESSTDLVFAGHSLIAENGTILAETDRFHIDSTWVMTDIDVARLSLERWKNNSFGFSKSDQKYRIVNFSGKERRASLLRKVSRTPFVPGEEAKKSEHCQEIFSLQTMSLIKRLRHVGSDTAVIGISGGLDSTLALLVLIKAFDRMGLSRQGIWALTMPGFGTSEKTKANAIKLAELLGVSLKVIPINKAVLQHFSDIEHDEETKDVTYENAQARERTQILMDWANRMNGLVIGTGDLSELALGWCTYNADHMSMYGLNSGVPKTLVGYLIRWCSEVEFSGETAEVLLRITNTPISPELLPPNSEGEIEQKTEEKIGPYILHDFFLFYMVRFHFSPRKILFLAEEAFSEEYSTPEILSWLKIFYKRFFSQQYKRSCLPDGPKIGSVALSPRGDWRMPSDASVQMWLSELNSLLHREIDHT